MRGERSVAWIRRGTSRGGVRLGCLRRPVVLRRRGACLAGGVAVSGRATDIADTARRACRALVRAGRRSVRLSGPIQRLNRVRSRRFDRYSGRRGAFVRCRSPFLTARASCSERCDAARRIVASLTRGLGAHCSRCRCVLSAARDPFHSIPRGDIFWCFHQASLQPRRCSAAKGNHQPRSTEQRHVRSAPRRSGRTQPTGRMSAITRIHQSGCSGPHQARSSCSVAADEEAAGSVLGRAHYRGPSGRARASGWRRRSRCQ